MIHILSNEFIFSIETMLGDVAIAVHPDDARYTDLVGKYCIHPLIPGRRLIIGESSYDSHDS